MEGWLSTDISHSSNACLVIDLSVYGLAACLIRKEVTTVRRFERCSKHGANGVFPAPRLPPSRAFNRSVAFDIYFHYFYLIYFYLFKSGQRFFPKYRNELSR